MATIVLAPNKKVCLNHDKYTYTGKEMSPLGLGYTAEGFNVGHAMEGRCGGMYGVIIKNNVKVWARVPSALVKDPVCPVPEPEPTPTAVDEPTPTPTPSKRKPRATTKKATTAVVTEVAPEPVVVDAVEVVQDKAMPKKTAAPKKKKAPTDEAAAAAPTEKRKPSAFNNYMKVRMEALKTEQPELTSTQRFTTVSQSWGKLTADEKAAYA